MNAIDKYVNYWDDWHFKWYHRVFSTVSNIEINSWLIPQENDSNNIPISRYFPEPFWGNPASNHLAAVFLHINPFAGSECFDRKSDNLERSILYGTYRNKKYSETVEYLSNNMCFITSVWYERRRIIWLNKLMDGLKKANHVKYSLDNTLCAYLMPWHTATTNNFVRNYITEHNQLIIDKVLIPVTNISFLSELKGLVFAKGEVMESILGKIPNIKTVRQYSYKRHRVRLFAFNDAIIFVFVGGRGMWLQDPCNAFYQNDTLDNFSIADIVKEYIRK